MRRIDQNRAFALALIAIVMVTAAAACGSSGNTTTRGPAPPNTFASQRYSFRVTLPPGNWSVQDAQADWNGKGLPDLSDPVWVDLTETATDRQLAVMSAPTGMALAAWKAAMQASELSSPGASHSCAADSSAARTSVGADPALEWTSTCASGRHPINVAVLHGTHGYIILLAPEPGSNDAENRGVFESIRGSFRFTR
jgi:hypothetical protein